MNPLYSDAPQVCPNTGFSGVGNPVWMRFALQESKVVLLSTCSRDPGIGFDTDLAVFTIAAGVQQLQSINQLEMVACKKSWRLMTILVEPNMHIVKRWK